MIARESPHLPSNSCLAQSAPIIETTALILESAALILEFFQRVRPFYRDIRAPPWQKKIVSFSRAGPLWIFIRARPYTLGGPF